MLVGKAKEIVTNKKLAMFLECTLASWGMESLSYISSSADPADI